MRIAIMAAGAVGGYFGARLAAAGEDVTFIARGAHLAAIKAQGLRVESPLGNVHVKNAKAGGDPRDIGPVDIVLFAVKLWDTELAAEGARPLIGEGTRLITLQNGIDSVELITPILGFDHVVGGTAHLASNISCPGVISHTSQFATMRFGRSDGRADPALRAFVESARKAGIDAALSEAIDVDRWKKFTFLVGLSGATAATRMPLGSILADSDTRAFFLQLMREVVAVGRASGVALAEDLAEDRLKFADAAPFGMKASLLHDLERGRRLELDWLAGKVAELGRKLKIPTPANDCAYAVLKLHRHGRSSQ
ncbi:MAG TPA: ketopantoate reductase family protein [Bryobacteraceae bacterium]|jgi:2-dehydropantoate 2-reductase